MYKEEYVTLDKTTIKALLDLSPRSMTKIAEEAGVNQANLSAWFTQDRYISEAAIDRVEKSLGVIGDDLSTDQVFVWRTDFNFETVQMLLNRFFDDPKIVPIVKKRVRSYELTDLYSQPLALVIDDIGHVAILIMKFTESGQSRIIGSKVPWFSPEFLKGTDWFSKIDASTGLPVMAQIDTPLYQHLKKGDVIQSDIKQIIGSLETISWHDVIELARSKNMDPQAVYDLLST